jgi:hypothetical protein
MKESDVFLSSFNICKYSNITKDVERYYNIRMLRQQTEEHTVISDFLPPGLRLLYMTLISQAHLN